VSEEAGRERKSAREGERESAREGEREGEWERGREGERERGREREREQTQGTTTKGFESDTIQSRRREGKGFI
jgi:hypothetical protein